MIKDRVVKVLEIKGIQKEKFFTEIGMSSSNFRGKPLKTPLNSSAIANIIALIPDVNLYWLITGIGEMFNSPYIVDEKQQEVSEPKNLDLNCNQIKEIIDRLLLHEITKTEAVRQINELIK